MKIANKKWIFYPLGVVFSLLLLIIIEMALRLFGYGNSYSIVKKWEIGNGKSYYYLNNNIMKLYFGENVSEYMPTLNKEIFFPKEKGEKLN